MTLGNGVVTTYSYNLANWVTNLFNKNSDGLGTYFALNLLGVNCVGFASKALNEAGITNINVPTMINYLPLYLPAFVKATLELSNAIGEVLPSITTKVGGVKIYEKNNMVHTAVCVM